MIALPGDKLAVSEEFLLASTPTTIRGSFGR